MQKSTFLRYAIKHEGCACYAFINEKKKRAYIQSTSSLFTSLSRNIVSIANKQHKNKQLRIDRGQLKFKFLESFEHASACLSYKMKWVEHYKELGYSLYNLEKMPKYLKRIGLNSNFKVQVQILSAGKRIFGVKEFDTIEEAQEWADKTSLADCLIIAQERAYLNGKR